MEALLELILKYLLDKGGVFGLLFALALGYIFFREKYIFNKSKNSSDNSDLKKELETIKLDLSKINTALDSLKEHYNDKKDNIDQLKKSIDNLNELNSQIENKIDDLHKWHSVFDDEGVPVWYVRKSVIDTIDGIEEKIANLQEKFTTSYEVIRSDLMSKLQKTNDKRIDELKGLLEEYNKSMTNLTVALEKLKSHLV